MDLEKLLGKELAAQVQEKLGDKKLIVADDGQYIPKGKFDEAVAKAKSEAADKLKAAETERDDFKKQLDDLSGKLGKLDQFAKDNEELKSQLETIKSESETAKTELEARLKKQAFDFRLDAALQKAGAKNAKAVRALLDTEKLSLDGDNIIGLDDQLKAVKEDSAYLFGENKVKGQKPGEGDDPTPGKYTREQVEKMSQAEVRANLPDIEESMKHW